MFALTGRSAAAFQLKADVAGAPTADAAARSRPQTRIMNVFATTGAALLVLALVGCAGPSATPSQPQLQADTQTADAIRHVIQQSNAEQIQAVASRDPTLISDTAT